MRLAYFFLLLLALLTSCDDAIDPGGDPVGTWRQVPRTDDVPPLPVDQLAQYTFHADGTLDSRGTPIGTWSTDEGRISIISDGHTRTETYVASGDHLLRMVSLPVGEHDGLVGDWHGDVSLDGRVVTFDLVFRTDGTGHAQSTGELDPPGDVSGECTYTATALDFLLECDGPLVGGVPLPFVVKGYRFPGAELVGGSLFERI